MTKRRKESNKKIKRDADYWEERGKKETQEREGSRDRHGDRARKRGEGQRTT